MHILSCIQTVSYTVPVKVGFPSLSVPSMNFNRLLWQPVNNRMTWDGACNPIFWITLCYLKTHFCSSHCRSWVKREVRIISERALPLLLKTKTIKPTRHYYIDMELNCLYTTQFQTHCLIMLGMDWDWRWLKVLLNKCREFNHLLFSLN